MLTRFRLINVEGIGRLVTTFGTFSLEAIDDDVASRLHARGSRYIEELPPPPATEPAAEAPASKPRRRGKSSTSTEPTP